MIKRLYYIILQRLYVFQKKNKPCQGKVYMFHNVNDDGDTYAISKDHFAELLQYLVKNKKIVDIETLVAEKDKDNVVITFDDVYASVFANAYPLLKEHDVPYYLFLCNEFLDKESYLDRQMIREMIDDSKAVIGSHACHHELSRFKDSEQIRKELEQSKAELQELSGKEVRDFAFPYGSIYACSKQNISDAGSLFDHVFMTYALAYNEEYGKIIPRININDKTYKAELK